MFSVIRKKIQTRTSKRKHKRKESEQLGGRVINSFKNSIGLGISIEVDQINWIKEFLKVL